MSNITFYKKTKTEIDEIDIEEGNILFDTTNKEILVDDDGVRESYGGAGGTNIVDLTRAEYNLLPESKKTDGKMYCITDEDVYVSANTVSLNIDGQTSNVQSGFDEISSNVDTINQKLDNISLYKKEKIISNQIFSVKNYTPTKVLSGFKEFEIEITAYSNLGWTHHFIMPITLPISNDASDISIIAIPAYAQSLGGAILLNQYDNKLCCHNVNIGSAYTYWGFDLYGIKY